METTAQNKTTGSLIFAMKTQKIKKHGIECGIETITTSTDSPRDNAHYLAIEKKRGNRSVQVTISLFTLDEVNAWILRCLDAPTEKTMNPEGSCSMD